MNITALHALSWQRLMNWRTRLPHALLISGARGLGKVELARAFAAALLCEGNTSEGHACGSCLSCRWFSQHHHPDFRVLRPEAMDVDGDEGEPENSAKAGRGGQEITIGQVRELDEFLPVGAHRQGMRVILIHPAENLNRAAANALLKILEDPPPDTLFLLVSSEPMTLLPTLFSRCQSLSIPLPPVDVSVEFLKGEGLEKARDWLFLAGGAPLEALSLAGKNTGGWMGLLLESLESGNRLEVIAAATRLEKALKAVKGENPLPRLVESAQKWLVDLNLASHSLPVLFYLPQCDTISTLSRQSRPAKLSRFYRQLLRLRRESAQPLNIRLFLESFFLGYRALFSE